MPKFNLDRSQRAKLAYEIRRFNLQMQKVGLDNPIQFEYGHVKPLLSTKREYDRFLKRLQRFSRPSKQRITINSQGMKMTQWEKEEFPRLVKTANLQRRKGRERAAQEEKLTYLPKNTKWQYRDRDYTPNTFYSRDFWEKAFLFEFQEGQGGVMDVKNQQYLTNLISVLNKWPKLKPIEALKKLLRNSNIQDVIDISLDSHFGLSISDKYAWLVLYQSAEDNEKYDLAEGLLSRWESALSMKQWLKDH